MDCLEQLNKIAKTENYDGYRCKCGCLIKTLHSHLVAGQSCECEQGETKLQVKENGVNFY